MDDGGVILGPAIVINFVLKGGPPWGFRIKQRNNRVIISKVNCGGRAHKNGLKVNDEIVAVNNLEIDKHPLTLDRNVEENGELQEIPQLSKLDFTYQLIKHTINRQLQLTVRRHSDSAITYHHQPCCYYIEDDTANEAYPLTEFHSQSEEEILSPTEEKLASVVPETKPFIRQHSIELGHLGGHHQHLIHQQQLHHHHHHHHLDPVLIDTRQYLSNSNHPGNLGGACCLFPPLELDTLPPGGHLTPSDLGGRLSRTTSEDSLPMAVNGPSYKARAPKNIWSPGSTTASSTESLLKSSKKEHLQPVTIATQTTPTKAESLPRGFRPVRLNSAPFSNSIASSSGQHQGQSGPQQQQRPSQQPSLNSPGLPLGASASNLDQSSQATGGPLSPSTVSEVSIAMDTGRSGHMKQDELDASLGLPINKYWTLPRHISIGSKLDRDSDSETVLPGPKIRHLASNEPPPPNSRFLYETALAKYFSVPVSKRAPATSSSFSAPEAKTYEGIGPLNEVGVPLALRTGVKEEYGSDWYKTMYKRLHMVDRAKPHDELKLKIRHEHHGLDTNYFSDDEGRRAVSTPPKPLPKNIADYVPGRSSVIDKEKEMKRRYNEAEFERRLRGDSQPKDEQHKHHFTPNPDPVVHLDRYLRAFAYEEGFSRSKTKLARVLFDFHALSSREISVKKDDVVIIQRTVNHNWVEVEDSESGLKGLVPRNYLDFEQEGVARAKFDFGPKTGLELALKKGDTLRLLRKVDENWFEGINSKNEMGIFPCSYVDTIKPPLKLQLLSSNKTHNNHKHGHHSQSQWRPSSRGRSVSPSQQPNVRSLSPLRSQSTPLSDARRRECSAIAQLRHHQQQLIDSLKTTTTNTTLAPKPPSLSSLPLTNGQSGRPVPGGSKLYRVIYPYKPLQQDELELITGDILRVTMHCDDGWFLGQSTVTGNCGTFPGNYVQPIP